MTLREYLAEHKRGVFTLLARVVGSKSAYRKISVPHENHRDIWVWCSKRDGTPTYQGQGGRVEAHIDRRTGLGDTSGITADSYEIIEACH